MREIHNLVEHGETATRSTLGGHSHARGEYLYFILYFVFLYILVTHKRSCNEVRQPPMIACIFIIL